MSPKPFECFMCHHELGGNAKAGRLTDAEFRCLITGVWALACVAPRRGYLMVGTLPAEVGDVARKARCSIAVAGKTLEKMRQLGMLEHDDEVGAEWCHDWGDLNPAPKKDTTNAERQRRFKERRNAESNAIGNASNAHGNDARNADVTISPPDPPIEGEGRREGEERGRAGASNGSRLGLIGPAGEACSILAARDWTVDPLGVEQAVYRCQQVGVDPVEAARHAIVMSSGQGHWQNAARALSDAADDLKRREQGASVRAVGPPALRLANAGDLSRFDRLDEATTKTRTRGST